MSTRKLITLLSISVLGSVAFAGPVAEPETPGSEAPKAVAEATHLAKVHGIQSTASQPIAQAPGSAQAQAVSEARHLAKKHGNVNDSADQRMLRDASRL